jgi:hypothetical protein
MHGEYKVKFMIWIDYGVTSCAQDTRWGWTN